MEIRTSTVAVVAASCITVGAAGAFLMNRPSGRSAAGTRGGCRHRRRRAIGSGRLRLAGRAIGRDARPCRQHPLSRVLRLARLRALKPHGHHRRHRPGPRPLHRLRALSRKLARLFPMCGRSRRRHHPSRSRLPRHLLNPLPRLNPLSPRNPGSSISSFRPTRSSVFRWKPR